MERKNRYQYTFKKSINFKFQNCIFDLNLCLKSLFSGAGSRNRSRSRLNRLHITESDDRFLFLLPILEMQREVCHRPWAAGVQPQLVLAQRGAEAEPR